MQQEIATPVDLKVLMNHIYEYKKGVRRLVLYTFNKKYESFAITRLERQNIDYIIQPVGNDRLNLFFGKKECLDAIRMIVTKPKCQLSPEEDFILGAMLGYDICAQCERYCERKKKACWLFRPICLVLGHMVICWWKTPSTGKKWQYCQKIFVKREFKEPFSFLVFYQIQGPCYRISW